MKKILCTGLIFIILLISIPFSAFSMSSNTRTYLINIHTSSDEGSSTSGDVYLKLYGDKGETAFWKVTDDIGNKASQNGRLHSGDRLSSVIRERDVGTISKVKVAYYQSTENDNTWGLDYLELDGAKYPIKKTLETSDEYPCVLDVALNNSENSQPTVDRHLVIEGRQYDKLPDLSYDKNYLLEIKTGDSIAAETNEIVRLQLVGTNGESDWLTINGNNGNGSNVFNRDTKTTFSLSAQHELGDIKELRIKMGTTLTSADKGWLLESVTVRGKDPCEINQWLQSADYLSVYLDAPENLMLIKIEPKTSASILSTPILVVIIGGSLVILATAILAVFIVRKRKQETYN
ncbi:MAG: PLAT/LH2 domain-containing protein [Clostridia bacterium]